MSKNLVEMMAKAAYERPKVDIRYVRLWNNTIPYKAVCGWADRSFMCKFCKQSGVIARKDGA